MAGFDLSNIAENPAVERGNFVTGSMMKDAFKCWLSDGHAKKYYPGFYLSCIDKASTYLKHRRILKVEIWQLNYEEFKSVYVQAISDNVFKTMHRITYAEFIEIGQVFLEFLQSKNTITGESISGIDEKFATEKPLTIKECKAINREESTGDAQLLTPDAIDPRDVVEWLLAQPNANGSKYLESVVRQYMYALRSAPAKIDMPAGFDGKSVFSCHTPEELTAIWDTFKAAPNYKQVNSATSGMFSAGMSCLMRYLNYRSDKKNTDKFTMPTAQSDFGELWNSEKERAFRVWMTDGENYSPKTAQIYTAVLSRTFQRYSQAVQEATRNAVTLDKAFINFITLISHDSAFVTENEKGHNQLTAALSVFMRFVASEKIDTTSVTAKQLPTQKNIEPQIEAMLMKVLSARFPNGYRLNSPIESARLRAFAAEELGEELRLTDEELKSYILVNGTSFDGKAYFVSTQTKEQIKKLADEYFDEGAKVIFYAELYAKNRNWLSGASVVSDEVLSIILLELFPKLSFTPTYFGHTGASVFVAVEKEILRIWGDNVLLTYEQLAERLQYIPLDRIRNALSQIGDFIWNSVETFSHISRFDITDEERKEIRETAVRKCNAHGYVSIMNLPIEQIQERNYQLSDTAIHNAVYRVCLMDKFDKKGKIITRKGDVFDALTIMKDYCRTIDKCSLDDLLNLEKELTGEINRWLPMEAGNTMLVRIDKDTYVADRYVHFDIDLIDEVIGLFITNDYLPLKAFITFGAFPDCRQAWNLFLLESYCRRFSRMFRFDSSSLNSRNAGVVIRKSCGLDYTEIMTDAVANSDVPLQESDVGRFLCESGYTGRSTNAKIGEIIVRARAMREKRT